MKPPTEKKAYCFSLNASDWLASPSVKLMSKAERGVYIMLLCTAWESKATLPASEDKVRRLADMSTDEWKESGEVLLEKFPLSECGTYRYNPRLMSEYEKQEGNRHKASLAGQKSAEVRAAEKAAKEAADAALQRNGNSNPTDVEINPTDVEESANGTPTLSKVKLSKGTSDEVPRASASDRVQQLVEENGLKTYTADTWQYLTSPDSFKGLCNDLRLPIDLAHESYRAAIQDKIRTLGMNVPASTLRSWIATYFINAQKKGGKLLVVTDAAVDLSQPTPKHLLPPVGTDCTGRHIVLPNTGDANMNRMFAANYARDFPGAVIHQTRA